MLLALLLLLHLLLLEHIIALLHFRRHHLVRKLRLLLSIELHRKLLLLGSCLVL